MTEAPEDVPAQPLVRSLLDPSPSLEFGLLRRNEDGTETAYPFRCRLLRQAQTNDALIAAAAAAAKSGEKAPDYGAVYRERQAVELLQRAIVRVERRDHGGRKIDMPLFVSAEQMMESLDTVEMAQLLNAYDIVQARFGKQYDDDEVEGLIDQLADELLGGYFLAQLPSQEWPLLISSLARLARSWRPDAADPTPSGSPSTSESTPSSSTDGTTGSSPLPSAHVSGSRASVELPTSGRMTRAEALEVVRKQSRQAPPDQDPDS